uniref:Related to microfibril-associated protein n=1 Tax=Melanopsichium pennsylvanicum 4 TaxID=1398559 RepID=A0A077R9W1_9BASI|nr:related to microfibril-associated protein [Melanopsichium pennsylvanicum 4]
MAPSQPPKSASRLARPAARYRPGKAPLGASLDDYSDSDESDSGHNHNAKPDEGVSGVKDLSSGTKALLHSGAARKGAAIVISDASAGGKRLDLRLNAPIQAVKGKEEDSSEYETDTGSEEEDIAKPVFRKPGTAGPPPPPAAAKPQHHVTADSGSSEYETDSSSEESSEEDAPQPLLKPVFKPKAARTTISAAITDTQIIEPDPETKAELEAAARRKEAHDLAEATIQRSLAERKHSELSSVEVDDTDGLDAEAEFAAWRERELARLKRDHDAIQQKLQEQRELECFKSLPESEKERLGRERAAQQRAEKKEQRGQPGFMQKYYHKGSFFQDMDIWNRDFTEKTEKDVDVRALPKIMQVRGVVGIQVGVEAERTEHKLRRGIEDGERGQKMKRSLGQKEIQNKIGAQVQDEIRADMAGMMILKAQGLQGIDTEIMTLLVGIKICDRGMIESIANIINHHPIPIRTVASMLAVIVLIVKMNIGETVIEVTAMIPNMTVISMAPDQIGTTRTITSDAIGMMTQGIDTDMEMMRGTKTSGVIGNIDIKAAQAEAKNRIANI